MNKSERDHRANLQKQGVDGKIHLIEGPMFGGKSGRIISIAENYERAGVPVEAFKHPFDDRYSGLSTINTHPPHERSYPCQAYSDPYEVYQHINPDTLVVIWDEVQFYADYDDPIHDAQIKEALLAVVKQLSSEGKYVILAGLGLNFRGETFAHIGDLEALANDVEKLKAVCAICGALDADRTQRLVNGEPAPYEDPIIFIGAAGSYEARCKNCHDVPGKPTFEDLYQIFLDSQTEN